MSLTAAALLHNSCDDVSLRSRSPSPASVATATTSSGREGGSMPPSSNNIQQQQQQQQHHHQISHTIQSSGSKSNGETVGYGTSAGVDTDHEAEAKKPRACDRCRGLKVRCIMEGDGDEAGGGNCQRCTKAGRRCVVTQPTKKRQKKTDSRVAELEKRIDALTASLHDSRRGSGVGEGDGGGLEDASSPDRGDDHDEPPPAVIASATSTVAAAATETLSRQRRPILTGGIPNLNTDSSSHMNACGIVFERAAGPGVGYSGAGGQKRKFGDEDGLGSLPPQPPRQTMGPGYEDVVTRAIVTEDMAAQLFARYTDHMCPHLPGVIFPPDMTWNRIRFEKPLLFLAVMAASSSETPSLQRVLVREMMQIFAEKIVIIGEKSIELVQALHIAVFWYWPPEHFEELKFYQLVHMAAVLAIDLGLGRRRPTVRGRHIPWSLRESSGAGPPAPGIGGSGSGSGSNDDAPATKRNSAKRHPPPDPCSLESRRTWLTCYYLASNTSMTLHRPNLVRWTPFMAECLEVLQTSPDAAPTDPYFCHLVWTHKLSEEIGVEFAMDDPGAVVDITDRRTQHAIKSFERQHQKYQDGIPTDLMRPSLKLGFHVVSLYMHEIALRIEEDAGGGCVGDDATLTPAHVSSLSACLAAVDGIFDTFSSMTPEDVCCLPVFNFVRVAYATVLLIKMYFAVSAPGSELGKVIDKEEIRVEAHLAQLLDKFRLAAAGNRSRPAAKFHIVIAMLRSWFQKQAGEGGASDAQEAPTSTQRWQEQGAGAECRNRKCPPSQASYSADIPFQTPSEITQVDEVDTNTGVAAGQSGVSMAGREATAAGVPWYVSQNTTPQSIIYEASGSDDPVPPLTHTSPSEPSPVPVHIRQRQYPQIPPQSFPQHQWMDMEFEPATFGDGVVQAMDPSYSGAGSGNRGGGFVLPGMMAATAASQNGGGGGSSGMMFSIPPLSGTGATGESPFAASESWYGGILDSAGMGNMYYL
ncbi:hypothetical protein PgNI_06243 [Pyricularia grisea]|uniref:Zn(2)-C6 fungal-type domain-containing protein n=1 Tax=Pyricularia grisea TaxID=148305 RepID=A0A6P8B6I4_PYRGI|nr:hypothetical protein PgNI_06243 [Pyricularia grisea]TLD10734.1 hypothetical protein PgNI_06243 [Pyricularia grisea]